MRLKKTLSTLSAATAVSAAGLVGLSAPPAAAAGVEFTYGSNSIGAWQNNRKVASVTWQAEPGPGGSKGDTLCAKDHWPDGRYVVGYTNEGHTASTKGHASSYTKCVTKNVSEGRTFNMQLYMYGSGGTVKSLPIQVIA